MKLKTNLLALTSSLLLAVGGQAVAQTPKDQIALQLGAIQMGYTVPFAVSANSTETQKQQAANALVMGRNAMNATVALPASTVKGVVKSPSVNTADYRDQLYSAVEYVVTSPVSASINGTVVMSNNATVTVNATALRAAAVSNDWMTPVPYALESRSSVDTQALREELVAAGFLKNTTTTNSSQTKSFFFITETILNTKEALIVTNSTASLRFGNKLETFEVWLTRKVVASDRIVIKNGDFWKSQTTASIKEWLTFKFSSQPPTVTQLWFAVPVTENDPKFATGGGLYPLATPITKDVIGRPLVYKGTEYKLVRICATQANGATLHIQVGG